MKQKPSRYTALLCAVALFLLLERVHSFLLRSSLSKAASASSSSSSSSSLEVSCTHFYSSPPQCYSLSRSSKSRLYSVESNNNHPEETTRNGSKPTTENDNQNDETWELLEDWTLQDRVPDFTVSTTRTIATFWRQLKHTIPELSTRTELELEERYRQLAQAAVVVPSASKVSSPTGEKDTVGTPFVASGKSPEVLTNWWMDVVETTKPSNDASSNSNGDSPTTIMMMHGRLSNGSNIWFPLQSAGTVGNPSNNDPNDTGGFSWLLEEGNYVKYVESSAGSIYELGIPKPVSKTVLASQASPSARAKDPTATATPTEGWALSPTSVGVTLSAVLASAWLSATLAFSAGQQQQAAVLPATTPSSSAIVIRQPSASLSSQSQSVTPAIVGSGMKYERTVQKDGSVKIVELSLSEQRASQEIRVYRDERRIQATKDKLESDKAALQDLQIQEARLGPQKAMEPLVDGVPRSPKELSVSEQRARAELKIGADKRRIQRLEANLVQEKATLQDLQRQEKQQQLGTFFRGR